MNIYDICKLKTFKTLGAINDTEVITKERNKTIFTKYAPLTMSKQSLKYSIELIIKDEAEIVSYLLNYVLGHMNLRSICHIIMSSGKCYSAKKKINSMVMY